MTKETGRIQWTESAQSIHNLVRGVQPWPGAFTTYEGAPLKIWQTKMTGEKVTAKKPGSLYLDGDHFYAVCGKNGEELLELCTVQPANKARMSARNWANGIRLKGDEKLG
jgi:methionyl-tRNA formyltransferase